MRFWDTSAVVPLLTVEPSTPQVQRWIQEDPEMVVWWGTPLECISALARREREGNLSAEQMAKALAELAKYLQDWAEVEPSDGLRTTAQRLLRVHPLRAADALQLAAAITACDGHPGTVAFVSYDERLRKAADREGLTLYPARLP